MQLVIDIGNTDAVLGFFKDEELKYTFRLRALKEESSVYFEYLIRYFLLENELLATQIKQVVISSVVPPLTPHFEAISHTIFHLEPLLVKPAAMATFGPSIDDPSELGSDLFANSVAAFHYYQTACLIVDFGTALTFTAVNARGGVEGVAIAPGLKTAVGSLFAKTAQLPSVPLETPPSVIGKNTIHAIQAGVVCGYEGLISHLISQIKSELGDPVAVIATGGLSGALPALHPLFDRIDMNLTLFGIHLLGKRFG